MIRVQWSRGPGRLKIEIDGHEFEDAVLVEPALVCAAVSALGQGLIVALEALAEQHPDVIEISSCNVRPPRR
jgi:uncharacterized protein YsxB (DUF464 family)